MRTDSIKELERLLNRYDGEFTDTGQKATLYTLLSSIIYEIEELQKHNEVLVARLEELQNQRR